MSHDDLTCPRCDGSGRLVEWCIERKVAMLAFLYVRRGLLCHLCRGGGRTSQRSVAKWAAARARP